MKYGVTISYAQHAYVEVEAESEEEAIEVAADMDEAEYRPIGDTEDFEAELLDEGNKKWNQN